jgi:cobaltochelatase CobT
MDSATAQANDAFYLDNHLQQVVHKYDRPGQLEIYGLGVGLDLSPYYRKHLPIDPDKGLDNQLLRDIAGLWG